MDGLFFRIPDGFWFLDLDTGRFGFSFGLLDFGFWFFLDCWFWFSSDVWILSFGCWFSFGCLDFLVLVFLVFPDFEFWFWFGFLDLVVQSTSATNVEWLGLLHNRVFDLFSSY